MDNFSIQSNEWGSADLSDAEWDAGATLDFGSDGAGAQGAAAWQDALSEARLGQDSASDGSVPADGAAGQDAGAQSPIVLAQASPNATQPAPATPPSAPAAPPAPAGAPAPAAGASPNAGMTLSQDGLNALYDREAQAGVSNHTHFPGGASGVTLGPGYDMGSRTPEQVASDLMRIGIDPTVANTLSQGAGLHGADAQAFATAHHDDVSLTDDQQRALLAQTPRPMSRTSAPPSTPRSTSASSMPRCPTTTTPGRGRSTAAAWRAC